MEDIGYEETARLVQQTLNGNASAYDKLLRTHYGAVRAIALSRLRADDDSVDELVQEVLLRAWLHLPKLSHPERFAGWLTQITRNLATDWNRRERVKSGLAQMVAMPPADQERLSLDEPSPRDVLISAQDKTALRKALDSMPADQREILLLCYSENIPQVEIARIMSIHPSTVTRRLKTAIEELRRQHGRALEEFSTLRADGRKIEKLSAIMAAAWGLNQSARKALASSAPVDFILPNPAKASTLKMGTVGIGVGVAITVCVSILVVGLMAFGADDVRIGASESSGADRLVISAQGELPFARRSEVKSGKDLRIAQPLLKKSGLQNKNIKRGQAELGSFVPASENVSSVFPAQGDTVQEIPGCVSLDRLERILLSVESLANSATYTFQTSQTAFGRTPGETFILDLEGTSTLSNGAYRIQYRITNRPGSPGWGLETISSDASGETVTVELPNGARSTLTDENRHMKADNYDPLKALLRPPFDKGPLSAFVREQSRNDEIWTTCSVGRNGARRLYFGGADWTIRLNPACAYFPEYVQSRSGSGGRRILEKEVTSFGSVNGMCYPREFAIRSYVTKENGTLHMISATTASVTMLKMLPGIAPKRGEEQTSNTGNQVTTTTAPGLNGQSERESEHRKRILEILRTGR